MIGNFSISGGQACIKIFQALILFRSLEIYLNQTDVEHVKLILTLNEGVRSDLDENNIAFLRRYSTNTLKQRNIVNVNI